MSFKSPTLSQDARLACLLRLAIRNLTHVQNLRIIHGHWLVTIGLLTGLFDKTRPCHTPIRKLWLENCSLDGIFAQEQDNCSFSGLESVRFRRMMLTSNPNAKKLLKRGHSRRAMHNGRGGRYYTSMHRGDDISTFNLLYKIGFGEDHEDHSALDKTEFDESQAFDANIFSQLPEVDQLVGTDEINGYFEEYSKSLQCSFECLGQRERQRRLIWLRAEQNTPADFACNIVAGSMSTLTSLNLDWVFLVARRDDPWKPEVRLHMPIIEKLSTLRFPHLRALQLRNAVIHGTMLSEPVPLLGTSRLSFLDFMEAHQKLKCLGWPMAHFFTRAAESKDVTNRVDRVIESLSTSLIDLRVDAQYSELGEPQSQVEDTFASFDDRRRRRLFITNFASRMRSVQHIKIEGSVPRDERRETLRALQNCRLQRIVSIGVTSPIGNTWGEAGSDVDEMGDDSFTSNFLEGEHTDAIISLASSPLEPPQGLYHPSFGWGPSAPLLHTIASYHASTITELKFCGYLGAPILGNPTPITDSFLYPLRHFHNLRQLVLSMWLRPSFGSLRPDDTIIEYWIGLRELKEPFEYLFQMPDETAEAGCRTIGIETLYEPELLAKQTQDMVAKHLSPRVKERSGGVKVRASFSLGVESSSIFDLDVGIGKNDEILGFKGPREELEPERREEKLENRRWF